MSNCAKLDVVLACTFCFALQGMLECCLCLDPLHLRSLFGLRASMSYACPQTFEGLFDTSSFAPARLFQSFVAAHKMSFQRPRHDGAGKAGGAQRIIPLHQPYRI